MNTRPWSAREAPLHRGVVEAHAVWLPASTLSEPVALRRALELHHAGSQLWQTPLGLVLTFAVARRIDCELAPGTPLCRLGGALASAAFSARALQALPASAFLLVLAGQVHCLTHAECHELDWAQYVDVEDYLREVVETLGAPPAPPKELRVVADPNKQVGAKLGRDELEAVRHALTKDLNARAEAEGSAQGKGIARGRWFRDGVSALAAPALAGLGVLANLLARLWPSGAPRAAGGGAVGASAKRDVLAQGSAKPKATPAWLQKIYGLGWRVRGALQSLALRAGLGRKQAQYVANLLQLIERQDDLEALRHAIPLGGSGSESDSLALLPPKPRGSLGISARGGPGGGSLWFGDDLYAHLQRSYERMFERLDKAGRYDEAAFVLAELLRDAARAVAYLERRKQLRLAAELAEGRELAPDLVVRQWFIAGERERALDVAAKHGAFAAAIARLRGAKEHEHADALSALYADRLARAGHLVQAAKLVGHVEALRRLALEWLALARASGEVSGLGLELAWNPGAFNDVWRAAEPLLSGSDPAAVATRMQLAHALHSARSDVALPIARALARQLVADAGREGEQECARLAGTLAAWAGGGLAADLPTVVTHELRDPAAPLRCSYALTSGGGQCVHDVHRIGKRWLVALGEQGVVLLDEGGRRLTHFDAPAERFVTARGSPHVLALAKRGDVTRVTRIHTATRRAETWTELMLTCHAETFDGERWLVVLADAGQTCPHTLSVLDVLAASPRVLKKLPLNGEPYVQAMHVWEEGCSVVVAEPFAWPELLRYSLPQWQLRSRKQCDGQSPGSQCYFIGRFCPDEQGVSWLQWWLDAEQGKYSHATLHRGATTIPLDELARADEMVDELVTRGDYFALSTSHGRRLLAGSWLTRKLSLILEFQHSAVTPPRLMGSLLYFGDRAGRVFFYDVRTGRELAVISVGP